MVDNLAEVIDRGEIRLAVEFKDPHATGFPPEMYLDPETGRPWGVGPILFDLIAADLGVTARYVDLPWPEHMGALESGQVDVILSTNTPARALRVSFMSGRLMANRVVCLVPADRPRTLEEIDQRGVQIACWRGSSVVDVARAAFPAATVSEHEKPESVVSAGDADVYINDSITHRFLELNPALEIVPDSVLSREYVHFAVRQGDRRLLEWLENWYDYHHAQGTIQRWCDQWWESFIAN